MKQTQKFGLLLCFILTCLCLVKCNLNTTGKAIPGGWISKEEHFDPHGFQDYTDYCKYHYSSAEPFQRAAGYHAVTADEIEDIAGYFANFRGWMATENRLNEYDFDPACISAGDYVRIDSREGQPIGSQGAQYKKYDSYTLYFFDNESMTLYYIHNNI